MTFAVVACGGEEETTTTAAPATGTTAAPGTDTTAGASTDTTGAPSGEVKTLKIGTIMGLTGPLSVPALAFNRGWEISTPTPSTERVASRSATTPT